MDAKRLVLAGRTALTPASGVYHPPRQHLFTSSCRGCVQRAGALAAPQPQHIGITLTQKRDSLHRNRDHPFGSRWDNVLALLRIPPSDATKAGASSAGGWGGGESDEHKALKHFVKANPHLVGAEPDWHSEVEYALRSGDEIDVLFKSARQWIGVEVKSCVSDKLDRDYERGLYQTVKYAAVLEAQAQVDHPNAPPSIRVFLVLERTLPLRLLSTAKALGVTVLENIKPIA